MKDKMASASGASPHSSISLPPPAPTATAGEGEAEAGEERAAGPTCTMLAIILTRYVTRNQPSRGRFANRIPPTDSDIDEVVPVRGSVREPCPRRAFSPISSSTPLREPGSPAAASRSPDTASPIYPDRAIRPLPRSRLKSRLSPEQASTIVYPPAPPPLSPTLRFGPDGRSRPIDPATGLPAGHARGSDSHDADRGWDGYHDEHVHADEAGCTHVCTCGEDVDSGDDEVEFDHPDYRYHPPTHPHPGPPLVPSMNGKPMDAIQRRLVEASKNGARPPSLPHGGSLASSADGYESFENTSNKKKRKIPLSSANSSLQQHQLSAEMANMGLNGGLDGAADDGGPVPVAVQHQAPHHLPNAHAAPAPLATASGTGISGAGRGRYGRQNGYGRNGERRPLGNSMSGGNGSYAPPRSGAAKNGETGHSPSLCSPSLIPSVRLVRRDLPPAAALGRFLPLKGKVNLADSNFLHLQTFQTASRTTASPPTAIPTPAPAVLFRRPSSLLPKRGRSRRRSTRPRPTLPPPNRRHRIRTLRTRPSSPSHVRVRVRARWNNRRRRSRRPTRRLRHKRTRRRRRISSRGMRHMLRQRIPPLAPILHRPEVQAMLRR